MIRLIHHVIHLYFTKVPFFFCWINILQRRKKSLKNNYSRTKKKCRPHKIADCDSGLFINKNIKIQNIIYWMWITFCLKLCFNVRDCYAEICFSFFFMHLTEIWVNFLGNIFIETILIIFVYPSKKKMKERKCRF